MTETQSLAPPPSSTVNTITIEGKQFGRGRALFPTWQMPLPAQSLTLRDFITAVVRHEVTGYRERQEERRLFRALTATEIAEGTNAGKIDAGGKADIITTVEEEQAVTVALQAFTDGLYFVFIDDVQQEDLKAPVALRTGSQVMFLRLVALAGG